MCPVRSTLVAGALASAGVAACGNSGGPSGPAAVTVVSGNAQSAHVNTIVPQPLVVRVSGGGGSAFQGATVAWAVTGGAATASPTSTQSGADGRASTAVTLGATPGPVTVSATVSGVTPAASFAITSVGPQTITKIAGDGQTGPVGGGPPDTLVVRVNGTDGQPYVGGSVTWAVTSGGATVNPVNTAADANGEAVTRVSLSAAGPVTLTASITGLAAVTFTAGAILACDYLFPYTLGRTVSATLSSLDCNVPIASDIYYYDFYRFTLPAQQGVSLRMSASALPLDPWLDLFTFAGSYIALANDSSPSNVNSYMEAILGAGDYVVAANSAIARQSGAYTLGSATRPATIAGCGIVWATRAISVTEAVAATDCVDNSTPGSPFYFDRLWLALDAAATIEVRMQSSAVNPFLYLYDLVADSVVVQNDDSGVGTTAAYINYAAPAFSIFELGLTTSTANQTGAYTVIITGPVSVAGAGLARAGALFALPELLRRDQRVTDPSAAGARSRAARSRGRYSP